MGNLFSFMLEGRSGYAAADLSAAISPTAQFIPLTHTSDFPSSDTRVFIEDEEIAYDSIVETVTGDCPSPPCLNAGSTGRGSNNTTATAHAAGIRVVSESLGLLNQAVGFQVGQVDGLVGRLLFPIQAGLAILKLLGKMVMWDYSFLTGNAMYVKVVLLYPLSAGAVIGLVQLFRGVADGLFRR